MSEFQNEYRVEKFGSIYKAFNIETGLENTEPRQIMMQLAYENGEVLYQSGTKWRRKSAKGARVQVTAAAPAPMSFASLDEQSRFIQQAADYRPADMIISDLKWKFLIRSIIRGKNILVTGPAGAGKTQAAVAAAKATNRPLFQFNLGASQDPKSFLIGNTLFDKEKGTFFAESAFIKAIETENAVILMDEMSRAHPDAWNILMTILDPRLRYVRIDDDPNSPVINVAPGVSFIATANIGNEYTATRVMDQALLDRFVKFEMDILDKVGETALLKLLYPELPAPVIKFVTEISSATRDELQSASPKISKAVSTRMVIELADLLNDGFTLAEAAECTLYPQYSADGGAESERVFIKQVVQKYCVAPEPAKRPNPTAQAEVTPDSGKATASASTNTSGVKLPF